MSFFSNLFKPKNAIDFAELVQKGAVIIDVRSAAEYNSGHIAGSVNIELAKINAAATFIQQKNKPVITVCYSGNRSAIALQMLKTKGIEAYNGGGWNSLQKKIAP